VACRPACASGRRVPRGSIMASAVGALPRRVLGSGAHALSVSAQGFGCMGMTANYGEPMSNPEAVALIKAVFQAGVTFWDTAEAYNCPAPDGSGTTLYNESVLGGASSGLVVEWWGWVVGGGRRDHGADCVTTADDQQAQSRSWGCRASSCSWQPSICRQCTARV
jgi:hypothetical protein